MHEHKEAGNVAKKMIFLANKLHVLKHRASGTLRYDMILATTLMVDDMPADSPALGNRIYTDILEHIDLGVIVLDTAGEEVVFQNHAATTIFEGMRGKLNYKTISALLLQGMVSGQGLGNSQSLHFKNRLLGYTVYVISDQYLVILIRDITESARLESIAEAVNTMENITHIFSGIRHELGNPINSIKMTLSVLKKNLDRYKHDTIEEYVDRTLAEITRVEYLLKSLKSYSMFENPVMQDVDVAAFMELFQSLVAGGLERQTITLEVSVANDARWVRVDPRALQQVMLNLIANAVDALEGRDNPTITIATEQREDFIWITVHDNGVGIPHKDQQHLFKPFYTTKSQGTGLGLVITKKMVVAMNGRIGLVSEEGVGTTVTLAIPEGRHADD
jgi:signal transduction histidine kinase